MSQANYSWQDLRILLISNHHTQLLTNQTIREYLTATAESPVPLYAWDPRNLVHNPYTILRSVPEPFQAAYAIPDRVWLTYISTVTLSWLRARSCVVIVVCEERVGSELFVKAAQTLCDGDFWRQSMSQIIYRTKGSPEPASGYVQIDPNFPERVSVPLYSHAELLKMRTVPAVDKCLKKIDAQRWGRSTLDLSRGALWYKPTTDKSGATTNLGWQNLPATLLTNT